MISHVPPGQVFVDWRKVWLNARDISVPAFGAGGGRRWKSRGRSGRRVRR